MPRQILALSERYYRRMLYGCASFLSVAIVCALLFLSYSAFTQFRERQIGTFISKREQIKSEVDRLSARVLQFAEVYGRLRRLYQRELLPEDTYGAIGGEEIMRSQESLTVVPFSLLVRQPLTAEKTRLTSLLLLLRQASALPMFNPAEPGVTLDGFIYTSDQRFLAISPPLDLSEQRDAKEQGIARFISGMSAPVDAAFSAELERAVRAQGSSGQRVLWMSPSMSSPLMRDAVTRVAVRIFLDNGEAATAVFSVPATQFRRFFMKDEATPGLFVFEGQGSTRLLSRPAAPVDGALLRHIEEHVRHTVDPTDHAGHFHEDGSFFISQKIEGPEWVVVYTFTWRDVLAGLHGNFTTGAFWGLVSLLFVWAATLYFDRCVIGPLQKKALAMLESQQFSQTIIDTLPVGIAVYAPESGEVVLRNSVAARMLEQSALPSDVFYAQILTAVRVGDNLGQAMIEAELPLRDGGVSHLGAVWSRTRFSGQDVLLLGMVDLNMQKAHEALVMEAKTAADKANEAKSMFLAQVSHEIRTPLHGAIGHMELLARDDLPGPQRERVELIRHAFDMLMSLVNDILDITKIESKSITLSRDVFNVNDLLEECAQLFAPLSLTKGLQFYCLPHAGLEQPVRGDRQRLMQILQNLAGNAVKFTERGSITLSVSRVGGEHGTPMVRFEVSDTGIGVSQLARQRIFKPLEQADDSISRRFGGTGLGLSLCRHLAELMGGRITLSSEDGRGSVFGAEIPLEPVSEAQPADPSRPLQAVAVCLHCRAPALRAMLVGYLERWGAQVMPAPADTGAHVHLVAQDCCADFAEAHIKEVPQAVLIRTDIVRRSTSWGRFRQVSAFDRNAWCSALSERSVQEALPASAPMRDQRCTLDILVAEDDHVNLTLIEQQLATLGCRRVRLARNGEDALAQWRRRKPDLLITDLGMPKLDGISLAREIRRSEPQAVIVATTAQMSGSIALDIFNEVLYKPALLEDLERILARCVAGREAAPSTTTGTPPRGRPAPLEQILLEAFRQSWEKDRPRFEDALSKQDANDLLRILHRLQGGMLAMGQDDMAAEALSLQQSIQDSERDAIRRCEQWVAKLDALSRAS